MANMATVDELKAQIAALEVATESHSDIISPVFVARGLVSCNLSFPVQAMSCPLLQAKH